MRTLTILLGLLIWAGTAPAQEAPAEQVEPTESVAAKEPAKDESTLLTATKLRERVRQMRRLVLGGGPAVEKSEKEALRFYRRKIDELARRADELRTERDLKQAEYDLALDATLNANSESERQDAAKQAKRLGDEMRGIDLEIAGLERQGDALGRGVASIQRRIERRKQLMARFEQPDFYEELPYLSDELIDFEEESADDGVDPFLDPGFLEDLLQRDPERARELLFLYNPKLYWERFPLTPPRGALKEALRFPAPDLPGKR
jgi:prefoldin subunit 5